MPSGTAASYPWQQTRSFRNALLKILSRTETMASGIPCSFTMLSMTFTPSTLLLKLGHLQWADPFRTVNLSESVHLGRTPDRKGLPSGLCPFGSGGVPSGTTHFLGRDDLDWGFRQDGCLSVHADYHFGQFDKGNIFTN
jgi:hypothetical protein